MNYIITRTNKKVALPTKGYYKRGDIGEDIAIISTFLALNFIGYENKTGVKIDDILGDAFGPNLEIWIKEFQRNNGLVPDGGIGKLTLAKLREYGLE